MKKILIFLFFFFWVVLIFFFSSQNGRESKQTSNQVIHYAITVFSHVTQNKIPLEKREKIMEKYSPIVRKMAHFTMYFILGLFTYFLLGFYVQDHNKKCWFSLLFTFFYACSDEAHQLLSSGRSFQIKDILIDTLGSSIGIVFLRKIKKEGGMIMKKINFFKVVSILSFLSITIFYVLLIYLGLFPMKYIILFGIFLYGISFLFFYFIFKGKNILRKMGVISFILMSFLSIIFSYYLMSTNHFFNQAFENATDTYQTTYYIVSKKTSPYQTLQDIKNKTLHYYEGETFIKKALKKLDQITTYNENSYPQLSNLFDDLKNDKMELVLISKTCYELIFQMNPQLSKNDYQIIYQFDIKNKMNLKKVENQDMFHIYVGGRDFTNMNMDLNMIISINLKTHRVLLTSIPRDYYILVDGYQKKDTLSYMGSLGITTSVKSLENLFGISIDYYVSIDTLGLVSLVDEVGGINYCSDEAYTTTHAMILDSYDDSKGEKLTIKKGCQHLNGMEALTVARERKNIAGGDRKRQENCQAILLDILDQLKGVKTLTNYDNILNSLSDLYETTLPKAQVKKLMREYLNHPKDFVVETQVLDGEGSKDYVHMTNLIDWVMIPNMDTVNQAKNKMEQVFKK